LTTKEKTKDTRLRREYNITLAEWQEVFDFQKGVCYICERKLTKKGKPFILSVDHSHTTGQIRGLLCWQCNKAIAILQDNAEWASRVVNYLNFPPFYVVHGVKMFAAPGKVGTKKRAALIKKFPKIYTREYVKK
jgi:hypothetical protein